MDLFTFLNENEINYTRVDHPPVFTFAEAERLVPDVDAAHTKNIFIRDRKGRRHFLVVISGDGRVDLLALAERLGCSRLSMASAERLDRCLQLSPGSVSVLGVINDLDGAVEVILDEGLRNAKQVQCHPLVNDCTLVIRMPDLQRFLKLTAHPARWVDVPRVPGD